MQVILLDRVRNLGHVGDMVNVKPGYARNFLYPYGKALPATKVNIAEFEQRRAELVAAAAEIKAIAEKRAAALRDFVVLLKRKTADEGRLYGSVGLHDILAILAESGHELEKRELNLPEGPLRSIGEHIVEAHLHSDVVVNLKVVVEAE